MVSVVVPTANPSVLDSRNMPFNLPKFLNAGIVSTGFHPVPSKCTNTGLFVAVSWPTAQPSDDETTKIDVRLYVNVVGTLVIVCVLPLIRRMTPLLPAIQTRLLLSSCVETKFN